MPHFVLGLMGWDSQTKLAAPEYPCLIDENHQIAELYHFVNVPAGVWIDEAGQIVKAPDSTGASDGFRQVDLATFTMPESAVAEGRRKRKLYIEALKDWIENGPDSKYLAGPRKKGRDVHSGDDTDALAGAYFRLGVELHRLGRSGEAQSFMAEAKTLRPESWSFKRQAWEMEEAGKGSGPEFWQAVHELGEKYYYPPDELEND